MKKLLWMTVLVPMLFACDDDETIVPKDYGMKTFEANLNYTSEVPEGGGMPTTSYKNQYFFKFGKETPTVHTGVKGTDSYTEFNMVQGVEGENYKVTTDVSGWDVVFTAYRANLGTAEEPMPYNVLGTLINTESVKAGLFEYTESEEVSAVSQAFADLSLSDVSDVEYSANLDAIGYKWKSVDMSTGFYTVKSNWFYIIKTAEGNAYKMRFTGYQDPENKANRFVKIQYALMQ